MNARQLGLLRADPGTAPHGGVLVVDDSGEDKDGTKTAHVGRRCLGPVRQTDSGVITVTTLWADGRLYYPVHAVAYTSARHLAQGKNDPTFRTKLAIRAREGDCVPRDGGQQRLRRSGRFPQRAGGR